MSQRTIIELNHDLCPRDNPAELLAWAMMMRLYMGGADQSMLPNGVTYLYRRHHADESPLPIPTQRTRDHAMAAYVRDKAIAALSTPRPREAELVERIIKILTDSRDAHGRLSGEEGQTENLDPVHLGIYGALDHALHEIRALSPLPQGEEEG